jgi:hypothetical protein
VVIPPEKNPPVLAGVQGLSKSPMTTLCVGAKKWYSTMSPTDAVTVLGVKVRPSWPTLIWIFAAVAIPAAATREMTPVRVVVVVGSFIVDCFVRLLVFLCVFVVCAFLFLQISRHNNLSPKQNDQK